MHCLLTWNSFLCFTPILLPFPTSSKVFNNSGTCWHLSRMQCSKWFHCNVACKIYFIPQVRRCDKTKECNTCTHTYSHPQIHKQLKTNSTFLKLQCPVRQTKLLLSSEYFLPLHHSRASPWESRPYLLRWFQKPFRNLLHIDLWDSYWDDPFVSLSNKPCSRWQRLMVYQCPTDDFHKTLTEKCTSTIVCFSGVQIQYNTRDRAALDSETTELKWHWKLLDLK